MTPKKLLGLGAAIMIALATSTAGADDYKVGDIKIDHPWARASAGKAGAAGAFMEIDNEGTTSDRLVSAASPVAGVVQIHQTSIKNNVMTMNHIDGIDIPAGGEIELKPGSYHIMLMDLKAPIKTGEVVPLTLTFEKAGDIQLDIHVMTPGARGHDQEHMKGHGEHKNNMMKQD